MTSNPTTISRATFVVTVAALLTLIRPVTAWCDTSGDRVWTSLGTLHPVLIHFPVALIIMAFVAEALFVLKREKRFAHAARFMIGAAAWISVFAAVAGFALASAMSFDPELERAFTVHRVAGVATPVLAFLAAGMAESSRRTGQVWELLLYRVFLVMAVAGVVIAGLNGGLLVYGTDFFPW